MPGTVQMDEDQRAAMTLLCRDTDYIPKVANAGEVVPISDQRFGQIMHNGLVVEADGYCGRWMTNIIKGLRGHHEPQEEKAFHEVLRRIGPGAKMMEFGSWWSYYSLWFQRAVASAANICIEPDATHLELGRRNAALNGATIDFRLGAGGERHEEPVVLTRESDGCAVVVPVLTVDGLMRSSGWDRLDLLHLDIQGAETAALRGAFQTLNARAVRFVFVSTHHWAISGSPDTHGECLRFLRSLGAHICCSHTVAESFSGDGLIVASFDDADADFRVETAINHTDRSLFRPYEQDLAILVGALRNASPR
ncbi:FkbM family methyltransferase [Acidiferrimicrobium sp. IK]|uniref:FkbM family methyltransferase n=1 Tax=Acidiferrimicrobium sp. IK TaxID=2871700 RepID=UPI0021CB3A0C|nr:FkbM family methyltransferase [Acidiferrimicrobium sp. IK]MCU4185057.1 FkbM family methyltransferase [Acidiferrimicrobium sp. IK]